MDFESMNIGDVKFINSATGETLQTMQSIDASVIDNTYEKTNSFRFNFFKSASLTLENAIFNSDYMEKLFAKESDPDVVIISRNETLSRFKYLHKRTKNSRIRRKLLKKIIKVDHPIYNEGIKMKYSQITLNYVREI